MKKIEVDGSGRLNVPDTVEIPFIEGDGVGAEITPVMQSVVDAAVGKAYGGRRQIEWKEVLAGEKAHKITGSWLPEETMQAFRDYRVGIKGPLTTPVGGGIHSLNVALRQELDLYVCLRRCVGSGEWSLRSRSRRKSICIFSARIPRIFMRASNGWPGTPEAEKFLKFLTDRWA